NAAAFNDVDGAEQNEAAAFAVNADGPEHLAAAAARVGARLIHVSTDYVFDGRKGSPYDENDAPNPLSVYARSKREGERRVLASGAPACVLRTAWLYGRHGKNFVKAIQGAAARGGPLKVVADQVGSPTSTADLAAAIAALIRTPAAGLYHVVNAGAYPSAPSAASAGVSVNPNVTHHPIRVHAAEAQPAAGIQRRATAPQGNSVVGGTWTSLGPAPIADEKSCCNPASDYGRASGRMTSLAVDPTNAAVIFVGTAGGGVWKSSNAGASWTALTDRQTTLAIG